jgi:RNA polymerase sigma-70 factor (ECF subfamily)
MAPMGSIRRARDIGKSGMIPAKAEPTRGIPNALSVLKGAFPVTPEEKSRLTQAIDREFALVWRSLRRFGVPESMADDAAQHVFLTFAERLADVTLEKERSFLLAVSVRVAANFRRSLGRSREVPTEGLELVLGSETTPEQLLQHKQSRELLDVALASLPLDQRVVFVLFELEGFSLPEIAKSIGIPLGTATSRLRRARGSFESWVQDYQRANHE